MTRRDNRNRQTAVTPIRRPARKLRVHARFTPSRSAVHRRDLLDPPLGPGDDTVTGPGEGPVTDEGPVGGPARPGADTTDTARVDDRPPPDALDHAAEVVDRGDEVVDRRDEIVDRRDEIVDPELEPWSDPDDRDLLEAVFALPDATPDHEVPHPPPAAPPTPQRVAGASPPPGPVTAAPPRVGRPGRWRPVLVVAAAVVVLAVVLTVRGLTGHTTPAGSGSSGATATASGSSPAGSTDASADLRAWLAAQGPDVRVVADGAGAAAAVTAAGGRPVDTALDRAGPGDRVVRAVTTADVSTVVAGATGTAVVPVAAFPVPGGTLVGAVAVTGTPADVTAARATAADTARAACTALARNAAVTIAADARTVLESGTVDIRLTAFVAALAELGPVEVTSFGADAAEQAVGVPVRVVTVTAAADVDVRGVAERARGTYAPTGVAAAAGATTLTWSVEPDPAGLTVR